MAMFCCDTNFHMKIAGKYRLGRRGRARWSQLFYFRAGQGIQFGKILIRLDFHLPKEKPTAVVDRGRAVLKRVHLLQQGIKLVSETCNFVYRTVLDRSSRLQSASDDRSHFRNTTRRLPLADPMDWRPARKATVWLYKHMRGSAAFPARPKLPATLVSGATAGPAKDHLPLMPLLGTAMQSPFSYSPARLLRLQQETSRLANSAGPLEKKTLLQGSRLLLPTVAIQHHHRIWAPKNSTGYLSGLIQLTLQKDMRIDPAYKATARHSGQQSPVVEMLLPERISSSSFPGRRPSSVPGLFLKKSGLASSSSELVFKNQRNIEFEIEELKKVLAQVKEKKAEPFPASASTLAVEIKKQINMEQISDQVYHTIERRIRQERERRGL